MVVANKYRRARRGPSKTSVKLSTFRLWFLVTICATKVTINIYQFQDTISRVRSEAGIFKDIFLHNWNVNVNNNQDDKATQVFKMQAGSVSDIINHFLYGK